MDLTLIKQKLYSAVISDALDHFGYRNQSPGVLFHAYTSKEKLIGRCKTTLWADVYHEDPDPYALELKAVDECKPGDVLIAAASGSKRSGIWGELLSTAAMNSGCVGSLVHGCIRDIAKMRTIRFPVYATGKSIYDSLNRQKVIDIDVPVEINNVVFNSGDIVFCDEDGVVVVPKQVEKEVLRYALEKVEAENITRSAIKNGMKATEAYKKYGIL